MLPDLLRELVDVADLLQEVVAGMLLICCGKLCFDLPRHVELWNAIDLLLICFTRGRDGWIGIGMRSVWLHSG